MPVTTNVALGVGGGIAAYKAAELARALMERGFSVQVVMTRSAEEFVRPLTFAALTGRKVLAFLSQAHIEPDLTIEMFLMDGPVPGFGALELVDPAASEHTGQDS